jgi:Ni/Co efflux regulator RcnB
VKLRISAVLLGTALMTAIVAAPMAAHAQTMAKPATEKKITPQQQKMKDCAAKWKEEKAQKKVSGKEAYRTFIGGCLKS